MSEAPPTRPRADPNPRADPSRADPSPRASTQAQAPTPSPLVDPMPARQSDPTPQRAISADHHAGCVDVGRHRPHGGTRKVAASRTAHVHRRVHIRGRRDHWHTDHPRAVARAHVGGPERRRRLGARLPVHQPCRRMTTERSARGARGSDDGRQGSLRRQRIGAESGGYLRKCSCGRNVCRSPACR